MTGVMKNMKLVYKNTDCAVYTCKALKMVREKETGNIYTATVWRLETSIYGDVLTFTALNEMGLEEDYIFDDEDYEIISINGLF